MSRSYTIQDVVANGGTINVDSKFYNWIAAVTYYSDAYITPVTPSAGTLGVLGTVPGAGGAGLFADSPIDCTDVTDFASAGFPLESITSAPAGILGATHYRLTITGTEG